MDVRIFALRMTGRLRAQFVTDAVSCRSGAVNTAQTEQPLSDKLPANKLLWHLWRFVGVAIKKRSHTDQNLCKLPK